MSRPGSFSAFTFRKKPHVAIAGVCLTIVCAGCETAQPVASTLTPAVIAAGAKHGATASDLARGREIFATACTQCHRMQPIGKYSVEVWRGIVAEMSPRANLTEPERAQLIAYITAARQTMP